MKIINKPTQYVVLGIMTFVLMFGVLSVVPKQAHAFDFGQIIDPACLFACSKPDKKIITNTYTNSNNVNSNINSPGATVNAGNTVVTSPTPVVAYNSTPVYNYDYNYNYPYPQQNNNGPLQVQCYPMPLSASTGQNISWVASAYGGNNSYYYTWTGTDGLSGYGSSISKTYYASGYKSASVTVTSGGQTVSKNCDGTVNVYGDNYNYYTPNPNYYGPTNNYYPYTNNYYTTLTLSCNISSTYANTGGYVTWNAYPAGGNGTYTYSWSGTDGLYGSSQSVYYTYPNPGQKTATVTVYSNGQSMTQVCGTVNVGGNYVNNTYTNYNNYNSNNNGLDVACFSDPTSVKVNQPATWRAEVTGGAAPYTYSWTGTNGLTGIDSSVIKYYEMAGEKSAVVTIRSADGKTATRACSTNLTVRGAAAVATPKPPVKQPVVETPAPKPDTNNGLSAAALFSLKNVPWGWVAILVILVLFATVVYLIFNRPKI